MVWLIISVCIEEKIMTKKLEDKWIQQKVQISITTQNELNSIVY